MALQYFNSRTEQTCQPQFPSLICAVLILVKPNHTYLIRRGYLLGQSVRASQAFHLKQFGCKAIGLPSGSGRMKREGGMCSPHSPLGPDRKLPSLRGSADQPKTPSFLAAPANPILSTLLEQLASWRVDPQSDRPAVVLVDSDDDDDVSTATHTTTTAPSVVRPHPHPHPHPSRWEESEAHPPCGRCRIC